MVGVVQHDLGETEFVLPFRETAEHEGRPDPGSEHGQLHAPTVPPEPSSGRVTSVRATRPTRRRCRFTRRRIEEFAVARVLVIDDEDVIGAVLRYAFLEQGHETLVAEGGRRGIERALLERPDAIVLDLMMPGVTGHDVLAALRDDAAEDDVPILVLTAVTQIRERERCLAEGADKGRTKPFDPREVASVAD